MGRMMTQEEKFALAIADETRRELMRHLCCDRVSVNDLVVRMGGKIDQPTVSHHLKKLEKLGMVHVSRVGKYRYYTLNREHLVDCCERLMANFAVDSLFNLLPLTAIPVLKSD